MQITAALAADLTTLTEALDDPSVDIAQTVRQLAVDAKLAVRSYLGLTVTADGDEQIVLTAMEDFTEPGDVRTSLHIPFPGANDPLLAVGSSLALILYAGKVGAFVDLAADIAWLTGRRLADLPLDRHLPLAGRPTDLSTSCLINQAIGVLIGGGLTPEQADHQLGLEATQAGATVGVVAGRLLSDLGETTPDAV